MAISKVRGAAQQARASQTEPAFSMSKDQRKEIKDLIQAEVKNQPATPSRGATPPADGGQVFARYVAPSPDIVARYIAPMPDDWSVDAHQSLINKVVDDKKVTVKEARLLKALFNYDIDFADGKGRNVRPQVAQFLNDTLADVTMSKTAQELLFGPNGPGYVPQPIYIMPPIGPTDPDGPYYIMPPIKPDQPDGPLYILPPGGQFPSDTGGPMYVIAPDGTTHPGSSEPMYIIAPDGTTHPGTKRTSPQQALMDQLQAAKKPADDDE